MISRREYEEFFGKVSDEDWAKISAQIGDVLDKLWEEDHPLDE